MIFGVLEAPATTIGDGGGLAALIMLIVHRSRDVDPAWDYRDSVSLPRRLRRGHGWASVWADQRLENWGIQQANPDGRTSRNRVVVYRRTAERRSRSFPDVQYTPSPFGADRGLRNMTVRQ